MNSEFEELLTTTIKECYVRRNIIVAMFVIISLAILAIGTVWPKRYTASVLIEIDSTNILQPLMQGRAVTTKSIDQVANAREIIFGEEIMNTILAQDVWKDDVLNDLESARLKELIKKKVSINRFGKDLVKIEFVDSNAIRAYQTVSMMANLFIDKGEQSKIEESQSAFDFINKQVGDYLQKLIAVEDGIKKFRSENPDVRPGLITEVSNKISNIKAQIDDTDLEIREASIKHESIKKQLSGEATIAISQSKEGQYLSTIAGLQNQVQALRLDYKDTYPDIVRLNNQINDLKLELHKEIEQRKTVNSSSKQSGDTYADESILISPLYQELRSNLSSTETRKATLETRRNELSKMLKNEYSRAAKIHTAEATLSDLTRDYQVNQDIYQDLLKRRENARVSKSLDQEHQGLAFKIQEPAKIPILPSGMRFLHFIIAGPILGLLVSIGLIFLFVQYDSRIRSAKTIVNILKIPVLVEIDDFKDRSTIEIERKKSVVLGGLIIFTAVIYIYASIQKYLGIF